MVFVVIIDGRTGMNQRARSLRHNVSRRWILAGIVLCMALALPAWPATASKTILVMGDSLSAGYGIDVNQGWVALLGKRLAEQGYGYQVVNASVSGETSSGGKARLPAVLKQQHPDIVILELGANDGLRGLPITQMRNNLTAMMQMAKQQGADVVLVGMQMPPNYGPAYTKAFAGAYTDLAARQHAKLVPFLLDGVAADQSLMQGDNLHPNERGQPRVLDNVWAILRTVVKK
jgi:acyl-CoA thioesterase I